MLSVLVVVIMLMLGDEIDEDSMIEVSNVVDDDERLTIEDEEDGEDVDVVDMIFDDDDISRIVDDTEDEV